MKLTKAQLEEVIDEILRTPSLEIPGFGPKTPRESPMPVDIFNQVRELWPAASATNREQVAALEDIYRLLDKALIGTGTQAGLLRLSEDNSLLKDKANESEL